MASGLESDILNGLPNNFRTQLKELVIHNVKTTDKVLGKGSFGIVKQLEINGLK